jgi:hypothetical protein
MDTCSLTSRDILWLLSKIGEASSSQSQELLAWIVSRRLDPFDVETFDAALTASRTYPVLHDVLGPWISCVPLNTPEAAQMRADYEQFQKYQQFGQATKKSPPPADPQALGKILTKTTPDAFFEIWYACGQGPAGNETTPIEPLKGWSTLDATTRIRILEAAKTYLTNPHPLGTNKWWKQGQYSYYEIAGYDALSLLHLEGPNFLEELKARDWERWARIVVCYPFGGESKPARSELLRLVYDRATDTVLETLDEIR